MGSQGFRNVGGNPFVYQEDIRSVAIGLDLATATWKVAVSAASGALPTSTAQITIDPAAAGNITIAPNGAGLFIVGSTSYPKTTAIGDVLVASAANTIGVVTGAATAGHVLMANGAGSAPTFQALPAAGITSVSGTANQITASTLAGAVTLSTPATFIAPGTIAATTTVTAGTNLISTAGNLKLPTTSSTVGQIQINSVRFLHKYNGTCVGSEAGNFTGPTSSNCLIGTNAGKLLSTSGGGTNGLYNCIIGEEAGHALTTSISNTFVGNNAGGANQNSKENVYIGAAAGYNTVSGSRNIHIGNCAGFNANGSHCIYIGTNHITLGESNVLKIGSSEASYTNITKAYIDGIYATSTLGTLQICTIDSNDQLGGLAALPPSLGGKMSWTTATANVSPMVVNTGYLVKHATPATQLVLTLPTTAALYSEFEINGYTAGMWRIAQNANQVIHYNTFDTSVGAGGYLEATNKYDVVRLRCVVANLEFLVVHDVGTLTAV